MARDLQALGLLGPRQARSVDGMLIGTSDGSTADLTLAGCQALAEACAVVTHRCIEDVSGAQHAWLAAVVPAVLDADPRDDRLARRFLASLGAVGQKLIDPRPLQPSSPAELLGFSLIWREASLGAAESAALLQATEATLPSGIDDLGGFAAAAYDHFNLHVLFAPALAPFKTRLPASPPAVFRSSAAAAIAGPVVRCVEQSIRPQFISSPRVVARVQA